MTRISHTLAGIIIGATLTITASADASSSDVADTTKKQRHALRVVAPLMKPCKFEDSHNCYWDAKTRGNGRGRSFVDLAGVVYYVGGRS
jgi:hypothetical protein